MSRRGQWLIVTEKRPFCRQEDLIMIAEQPAVVMEALTDSAELAEALTRRALLDRNWAWFEVHAAEIYRSQRGKCFCVSGEELFVADTPAEVLALAKAAHPEDDGRFTGIIPKEKLERIYAHPWPVAPL
jgi:hypothetical protein